MGRERERERDSGRGGGGRDRDSGKGGKGGTAKKAFSWLPADAISSGLISAGQWRVVGAFYCEYDYGGTMKKSRDGFPVVLLFEMEPLDGGEKQEETWTVGKGFEVIDEGEGIEPINGQSGFPRGSKIMHLFESLDDKGGGDLIAEQKASAFVGMEIEVERIDMPAFGGSNSRKDKDGKDRGPATVVVITEILAMPGEGSTAGKGKGKGKTAAASSSRGSSRSRRDADEDEEEERPARGARGTSRRGKDDEEEEAEEKPARGKSAKGGTAAKGGKRKPTDEEDEEAEAGEFDDDAKEAVIEALEQAGGKIKLAVMEDKLLAVLKKHKQRAEVAELGASEEFLETEAGWNFDGKVITLPD